MTPAEYTAAYFGYIDRVRHTDITIMRAGRLALAPWIPKGRRLTDIMPLDGDDNESDDDVTFTAEEIEDIKNRFKDWPNNI